MDAAARRPAFEPKPGGSDIGQRLAVMTTLGLLGLGAYLWRGEIEYARMARALDADVGTLRRMRWERPVLRGTAEDANAAAEAYEALKGLPRLPEPVRDSLAEKLRYGGQLPAAVLQVLAERDAALSQLRRATQSGFSRTELAPERGARMRVPDYPKVIDAALLLLARASLAAPDECLRAAADVIRLGQDLVPAAPLEAASVSARLTSLSLPVIARCVTRADGSALRRTAHELRVLATHPPPTGTGIELSDLVTAHKLRERAALSNKPSAGLVVDTLKERTALLSAMRLYADPTRFRQITPERYPDAIDEWKTEQDARARSPLPLVAQDARDILSLLHEDARGQALLRALAVGVATLAERATRGKLPAEPSGLREPALFDPYRGAPLCYRVSPDGLELAIWSVGENLADNGGSDEWSDMTLADITVHLPLTRAEDPHAAASQAHRRAQP